jgi:FKBP-type peptidyl-prolyl cis-trans isomerase 2
MNGLKFNNKAERSILTHNPQSILLCGFFVSAPPAGKYPIKRCCMNTRKVTFSVLLAGCIAVLLFAAAFSEAAENGKKDEAPVVSEGTSVKMNYTLTVDGKVFDSSSGHEPLQFKVGSHEVIPGVEKAVLGMKSGEKKSFTVSPEEGYGMEDPRAVQDVPKAQLPPDITPKAGMILFAQGKDKHPVPVKIKEVKEDVVVMDFNHPLAGKTLNFDIEVVEIK